jgi:hypothetical protein
LERRRRRNHCLRSRSDNPTSAHKPALASHPDPAARFALALPAARLPYMSSGSSCTSTPRASYTAIALSAAGTKPALCRVPTGTEACSFVPALSGRFPTCATDQRHRRQIVWQGG